MEILRTKIDNEINKRQLVIQLLSLLIGGLIGLLFVDITVKTIILMLVGLYYAFVLLSNYIELNQTVNRLIKEMEMKQWKKLYK